METQRSPSSTNVDDHQPQLSNTSVLIHAQTRNENITQNKKMNGKQKNHHDVVSLDFHDEVLKLLKTMILFSILVRFMI
jgi:hypothetical protein